MNEEAKNLLDRLQKEHDTLQATFQAKIKARGPMFPPTTVPVYERRMTPAGEQKRAANPNAILNKNEMELVITGYKEVGTGPYINSNDSEVYVISDLARQINKLKWAIELDEKIANSTAAKLEANEKALEAQGEK